MRLNTFGEIAHKEWFHTEKGRNEITLFEFIVMPNHIHGIIEIESLTKQKAHNPGKYKSELTSPSKNLGSIIRGYKGSVTKQINTLRKTKGLPVCQSNYHERIIQTNEAFYQISKYICENPIK